MEKALINVQTNGVEKPIIRVGSDIIELNDKSVSFFSTDNIDDFAEFVKKYGKDAQLYYDKQNVACTRQDHKYGNLSIAECNLKLSMPLKILIDLNHTGQSLESMEMFLKRMKGYMTSEKLLYKSLKNLNLRKIMEVKKQSSNNGDFAYAIKFESGGTDDFQPPENLTFEVPIFEHKDDVITLDFDFNFTPRMNGERCEITASIENLNLDEQVEKHCKFHMETYLQSIEGEKYWGALDLHNKTDKWMYHENNLTINEG